MVVTVANGILRIVREKVIDEIMIVDGRVKIIGRRRRRVLRDTGVYLDHFRVKGAFPGRVLRIHFPFCLGREKTRGNLWEGINEEEIIISDN